MSITTPKYKNLFCQTSKIVGCYTRAFTVLHPHIKENTERKRPNKYTDQNNYLFYNWGATKLHSLSLSFSLLPSNNVFWITLLNCVRRDDIVLNSNILALILQEKENSISQLHGKIWKLCYDQPFRLGNLGPRSSWIHRQNRTRPCAGRPGNKRGQQVTNWITQQRWNLRGQFTK